MGNIFFIQVVMKSIPYSLLIFGVFYAIFVGQTSVRIFLPIYSSLVPVIGSSHYSTQYSQYMVCQKDVHPFKFKLTVTYCSNLTAV
jgi:hypothetical protein